jgi:hypothetical protein
MSAAGTAWQHVRRYVLLTSLSAIPTAALALALIASGSAGVALLVGCFSLPLLELVYQGARRLRHALRPKRASVPAGALATAPLLVFHGDLISQLEGYILGFFQSIVSGIEGFFGTIFSSIANSIASLFSAPVNAVIWSWTVLQNWASGYGPLAPIVTIGVVVIVFLMLAWLVNTMLKLTISEGEEDTQEVEEGV